MLNGKTMILQYDQLKTTLLTGWWLEFAGIDYFFPQSECDIDFNDNTIEAPYWLVEEKGLEGYEL